MLLRMLAATIRRYDDRMRPGDVYALNDPFEGGMHLPDVFILKPIFHAGRRVAFAATICHQTDMGGRVAGSNASDSTEIFQEGLRIPPVRAWRGGVEAPDVMALLLANTRTPAERVGDLRAQSAARGEESLDEDPPDEEQRARSAADGLRADVEPCARERARARGRLHNRHPTDELTSKPLTPRYLPRRRGGWDGSG